MPARPASCTCAGTTPVNMAAHVRQACVLCFCIDHAAIDFHRIGRYSSRHLQYDALQTTSTLRVVWLVGQISVTQVSVTPVQVEKAKSQAAEQACHKAQEDAKQSVKHLNQVSFTAFVHAHADFLSLVCTRHPLTPVYAQVHCLKACRRAWGCDTKARHKHTTFCMTTRCLHASHSGFDTLANPLVDMFAQNQG